MKNNCDVCAKENCYTEALVSKLQLKYVKNVCDDCSKKLNKKLDTLRDMYLERAWKETKFYIEDLVYKQKKKKRLFRK